MADEDVHRLQVRAQTVEELRSFLDGASDLDLGCRPTVRREDDGRLVVDVYATLPQVGRLRATRGAAAAGATAGGVSVDVVENATATGRARQAEVGSGTARLAARGQVPRGLGIKE